MTTLTANLKPSILGELFGPVWQNVHVGNGLESGRISAGSALSANAGRMHSGEDYFTSAWTTIAPFAIGIAANGLLTGLSLPAFAAKLAFGATAGILSGTALALYKHEHGIAFAREVALGAWSGTMALGVLEHGLEEALGIASAPIFRALASGISGGFFASAGSATIEDNPWQQVVESGLAGAVLGAGFSSGFSTLIHGREAFCGNFSLWPLKEEFLLFAQSLKPGGRAKRGIIPVYASHGSPIGPHPPPPNTPPDPSEVLAVHAHRTPLGVYTLENSRLTRGLLVGLGLHRPFSHIINGPFGESAFTVTKTGLGLTSIQGVGDAVVIAETSNFYSNVTRQLIGLADGLGGCGDKGFHDVHAAHSALLSMAYAFIKREAYRLDGLLGWPEAWQTIEAAVVERAEYLSRIGRRSSRGMGTTIVFHLNEIANNLAYDGEARQVLRTVSGTAGDSRATAYLYENGQLTCLWDSPKHKHVTPAGVVTDYISNSFYAEPASSSGYSFNPSDAYIEQSPIHRFLLPRAGEVGQAKVVQLLASDGLEKALPENEIHLHLETGLRGGESIETIHAGLIQKTKITTEVYRRLNALALTPAKQSSAALKHAVSPLVDGTWLSQDLRNFAQALRNITLDTSTGPSAGLRTSINLFNRHKLGFADDLAVCLSATDIEKRLYY